MFCPTYQKETPKLHQTWQLHAVTSSVNIYQPHINPSQPVQQTLIHQASTPNMVAPNTPGATRGYHLPTMSWGIPAY
jgi:hypothetical protein